MIKQIEKNIIKINYSESLQKLAEATIKLLEKKMIEYKKIFDIMPEKIIVNYFDDLDYFRNFIYDIRGEKESLPKYAKGTYDNGMINAYIDPKTQLNRIYTASHELFHILYMNNFLKDNYSKRIVWYDEGMAQFMSGEKDYLKDNNKFKEFYEKVKINTKTIPNINNLKHGDSFYNEEYNAYELSYLSIRYLNEILDHDKFINLMTTPLKIKEIGKNIVNEMFKYYDEKYKKDN